jgi:carbon-monoxide dehydrogenase large subunit
VRYEGELVAAVAALTPEIAQRACELIEVEYEELEVVYDIEAALQPGAPLLHEQWAEYGASEDVVRDGNDCSRSTIVKGDVDAGMGQADVLVRERYVADMSHAVPIEPHAAVAQWQGDKVTVWSSTQVPHFVRIFLSLVLDIPESRVRVIAPDVGGGFGGKLQFTPEEVLTVIAARRTGRPCKYTETRTESLMAAHHGRDQIQRLTLAADRDGTVSGLKIELVVNMGAYLGLVGSAIPILGAFMYNGCYKFSAYQLTCTNVFTNQAWTDAYRGAGRPEATFAVERMMDELAATLGVDPLEIRERNWIRRDDFPFTTVAGLTYDSGDYAAATAKAKDLFGYDDLRAEQQRRRDEGDRVQLGIGVSTYTEMCGLAPSRWLGEQGYVAGGWDHASIRMLPTGKVEVVTGTSPHGQGHDTAWSQIVADRLGVPFDDIDVLHGDTQVATRGLDTYGSRSLVVGGMAVVAAVDKVIDKARPIAAHLMEANPDDLEFVDGRFAVRGTDKGMGIGEVAFAVLQAHNMPAGVEPSLDADATFDPTAFSYPHGTHLCAVEVDTETGVVRLRSYVCVDDVGKVVNPMIVEGQIHGGVVQGVAQALFEEAVYNDDGTLVTSTFTDYLVPSAPDLVSITTERTESPATTNELGVKGVGETGTIASTPAVVNAVVDALRPMGVDDIAMPASPERVWKAIRAARASGQASSQGGAA